MRILDFVKLHYNQCLKDYLYIGISFVFIAIFLRISFWAIYTTETSDILFDDETLTYTELEPGEGLRVHGDISEMVYYGQVEVDLPKESDIREGTLNLSSGVYLHGLKVVDNVTWEHERFHNITLSNLLLYDGDFSGVIFENVTFENVSFIKSSFSGTRFHNVHFTNTSFIDCTVRDSDFDQVTFLEGYALELDITDSRLNQVDFRSIVLSRSEFHHIEWTRGTFMNVHVNDSELRGIEFRDNTWTNTSFDNARFDVIIFNEHTLRVCSFLDTTFLNINTDHNDPFDHTYLKSHDVYIRIEGDIRTSYTEDTSFYGKYRVTMVKGNVTPESGEGIEFSFEIFEDRGTHHSLGIDGIFYTIILGGFVIITYAYGGKAVIMALVKFFMPFIFSTIGILILFLALPWDTFQKLGTWMILYFFPPLGKESVIPAAIAQGIHPLLIAGAIAFIDIMVGLFLVWNFDLARKIPLIGNFIRRIEAKGNDILAKKPWVEKLAFTGIILFVMFPFQGSGAVGATIVGRMLGMNPRKVWYAVIIGAIVGCLIIAYTSAFAMTFLMGIGVAWALLTVVLVVIFLILAYNYDKWGDWMKEVRDHLDHIPKE